MSGVRAWYEVAGPNNQLKSRTRGAFDGLRQLLSAGCFVDKHVKLKMEFLGAGVPVAIGLAG